MCGIYFAFGASIGAMPPLVDEVSADLDLSRSAMGSILGAWALIYVFTAVPGGALVDRLGLRRAGALGGLAITASLVLRSLSTGPVSLFAAVAVFGIGGPLVSVSAPKLVGSLFTEHRRRLPTGAMVAAPTLGSTVALAATNPLLLPITGGSWRAVLIMIAVAAAVLTLVWSWSSSAIVEPAAESRVANLATIRRLIRLPAMRWILLLSLGVFFFGHAFNAWLPEILTDLGQSDDNAGYLAALSTTVGIAGSLAISRLVASTRRSRALGVIFTVLALATAALVEVPAWLLVAVLVAVGFFRAGLIPLLFLEIMDHPEISVADIGAATGLFFAVGEIGGFSGPYVLGIVADRTDGFETATRLLAAVAAVAAVAALAMGRARRVGAAEPGRAIGSPLREPR